MKILPITENITVYPGSNSAGRNDADKVHVHMDLAFNSVEDAHAWLRESGVDTTALERLRPDEVARSTPPPGTSDYDPYTHGIGSKVDDSGDTKI